MKKVNKCEIELLDEESLIVLEFLDIKENTDYLETDLEKNILKH